MKFRIASDFHTEILETHAAKGVRILERYMLPIMEGEKQQVLLMAGDLGNYRQKLVLEAVLENLSGRFKHIYYIPGNHEYYNDDLTLTREHIKEITDKFPNILFSESFKGRCERGPVAATLWTDFNNDEESMGIAQYMMNDYKKITYELQRNATPKDMKDIHEHHKALLAHLVRKGDIVMTHHLPSFRSIDPKYVRYSELNPAYGSNLEPLIEKLRPKLWIHGHTHASQDYTIHGCRIICNPYGYHGHDVNKQYNPYLVVEI